MGKNSESCCLCENEFNEQEKDYPHSDSDGDPICDDCHRNNYQFICCCCEEFADSDEEVLVGSLFACLDEDVAPVGIYRIKSVPFYSSSSLSEELNMNAVEQISDNLFNCYVERGACGHICRKCSKKIKEETSKLEGKNNAS